MTTAMPLIENLRGLVAPRLMRRAKQVAAEVAQMTRAQAEAATLEIAPNTVLSVYDDEQLACRLIDLLVTPAAKRPAGYYLEARS